MTTAQLQALKEPISIEEIKLAMSNMKGNASPDSDSGITIECYKTFIEEPSTVLATF